MHITDISGLAGVTLAIVASAFRLPFLARLQTKLKIAVAVLISIAMVIPFGGLSAVEFVRGISGDLSITSLVLLTLFLILSRPLRGGRANMGAETLLSHRANPQPSRPPARGKLLMSIVVMALFLYPCALGISPFDPFRLGFGNLWFIAVLLVVVLIAWYRQFTLVSVCITLAVLAWSVGWYESSNLWTYLIDPWVAIYAFYALAKKSLGFASGN